MPTPPGRKRRSVRSARRRSSATAAAGATSAKPQVTIARKFLGAGSASSGASATVSARAMRTPSSTISSAGMWKPISGTITSPAGVPPAPAEAMLERTPSIAPCEAVAGDVELAAPVPEADQEAGRDLLGAHLADLDEGLEPPELRDVVADELRRQRRVAVHRKDALLGLRDLEVERQLRPGREQVLEQVGGLDGEPPKGFLEALAGALKRGHGPRVRPGGDAPFRAGTLAATTSGPAARRAAGGWC